MELRGDVRRLADVVGTEAATAIWQAFAGQTLYLPKLSPHRPDVRSFLRDNPDANPITVMSACMCSRSTYYRVRKEVLPDGHNHKP